jgi:hypothetical protein
MERWAGTLTTGNSSEKAFWKHGFQITRTEAQGILYSMQIPGPILA